MTSICAALLVVPCLQGTPDLGARLAGAVDLATPEERQARARELARDEDVSLEQWLAACESFEPLPFGWEQGPNRFTVDLPVRGGPESTTLFVVPPPAVDGPAPLLVVLHGAGGQGSDMIGWWGDTARELGAYLLAPSEAGRNRGFTGEPRERESVLEAIRWVRRRADIDENRIWVTGFSRGGILCWDLALRYPGTFAAAAPQAGGPRLGLAGGRHNMRYLDNLRATPLRAMVGEHDAPDLLWSVTMFVDRARLRGIPDVSLEVLPGQGHGFDPVTDHGWADWFAPQVRDPWPAAVVRRAAREDEATHAWVTITRFDKQVKEEFTPTVRRKRGAPDLGEDELRAIIIEQAEERTARAEVRFTPGTEDALPLVEVESEGVRGLRVLLPEERVPEGRRVEVALGARRRKARLVRDPRVLLETFVEGFDRTFLPVAKLDLKPR